MRNKTFKIMASILIPIIAIIISILIASGFFSMPNVLTIKQAQSDSICPSMVYQSFTPIFRNSGKGIGLCVNASSEEVNFTKSSDCMYLENRDTSFEFNVDPNSIPQWNKGANINITYFWSYRDFIITHVGFHTCEYEHPQYSSNLQLIQEVK